MKSPIDSRPFPIFLIRSFQIFVITIGFNLFLSADEETIELATLQVVAERAFETQFGIPADDLLGDFETSLSLDSALRKLSSVDTFR